MHYQLHAQHEAQLNPTPLQYAVKQYCLSYQLIGDIDANKPALKTVL